MPGGWRTVFGSQFAPSTMGSRNQTQVMGLHSDLLSHLPAPITLCFLCLFPPWLSEWLLVRARLSWVHSLLKPVVLK